jgi:hypothetical protein
MFGATLRCKVCNQYAPDRCTCNGLSLEQQRFLDAHEELHRRVLKAWAKNPTPQFYIDEKWASVVQEILKMDIDNIIQKDKP